MSPPGWQKMSAKPCNRNAEESFPVLNLKSREQKPPDPLLIQDKNVLQPRLDPLPVVGQQRRRVLLEAIGEEERHTAGRHDLDDLMDHTLRHGPRAVADINRHSSLVTGSMAAQTQCSERARRSTASAALTSPVLTALSRAKSSSSCTCVTRTSWRKYREKAAACSATSTSHARTVLGLTSNTRATARMPKPSANAPTAHTSRSGETRLP